MKNKYEIFADYFQFYIQDEKADGDLSNSWNEDAMKNLLALGEGVIGIGTVRNTEVPVSIEIFENEPNIEQNNYDKINECSILIKSNKLVIAGCTDYFPDAARLNIENGSYTVRVYYKNLNKLSEDGLSGDDSYRIIMWRDEKIKEFKKIK